MKETEALNEALVEAFKDVTDAEKVEALGKLKGAVQELEKAIEEKNKTNAALTEKLRDVLLGSYAPTGRENEDDEGKSFEQCLQEVIKGE